MIFEYDTQVLGYLVS